MHVPKPPDASDNTKRTRRSNSQSQKQKKRIVTEHFATALTDILAKGVLADEILSANVRCMAFEPVKTCALDVCRLGVERGTRGFSSRGAENVRAPDPGGRRFLFLMDVEIADKACRFSG